MSKLKPCPFCGNKAEVYEECELIKIRCSNYMCQASVNSWHDEVEDAIDAWNKRSADRPQGEWIWVEHPVFERCKCSLCGYCRQLKIPEPDKFCPNCGADMRERRGFQVIVNGNCTKCGKPLSGNRIFICEECEEQSKESYNE